MYWLIKSEGDCYSIDHLRTDKRAPWSGVRNFQARNFMMRDMKEGEMALFYHANAKPSGVYGLAKIVSKAHPDLTAQDKNDEHYDPKATKDKPIWHCVDFAFVKKFTAPLSLADIKIDSILKHMRVASRGNRLSITPVSDQEYKRALEILDK